MHAWLTMYKQLYMLSGGFKTVHLARGIALHTLLHRRNVDNDRLVHALCLNRV